MNTQLNEVLKELERANNIHSLFTSEHEGVGVLQEEVYELWDAIRSNKPEDVYHEATQVAAMAVKLMMYIDSINSRHSDDECDCETEETALEFVRLKHLNNDCVNRKKYGDAFDSMFGDFEFPKI